MDSIGKYMLEIILHQQRTPQSLKQKKLMQAQENHSNPIQALNVDSLKVDLVVIQNTCSEKEDNNSETASSKSVKECSLDSATKDVHAIKYKILDSAAKRTRHQRQYDRRVNKRQMQAQESKIDTGKAVNDDLVVIESSGTKSEVQDDNIRSRNDTDADDAYIRPIYDEEPMAEVDQYPEQRDVKSHMLDSSPDNQTNDYSKQSLEWKPMGKIFKSVGLRWIPTGKLFNSCTSKVDSEPKHGSNVDISNIHESKQTLDLSADTSINVQKEQSLDLSAEVPSANMIVMTLMIELESLIGPSFDEYFNGEKQVVSKSSDVTTADASIKRQQQKDSTSSTSTLPTTVTADGNFDL
nr:hypothetical protein [Tanacetum cinerariifolium]